MIGFYRLPVFTGTHAGQGHRNLAYWRPELCFNLLDSVWLGFSLLDLRETILYHFDWL